MAHSCPAIFCLGFEQKIGIFIFIEAMHLLPQSFEITKDPLLLPGSFVGSATLLLPVADRFFSKACRTSSRGRLFRFGTS
jgi:hypothetical protein